MNPGEAVPGTALEGLVAGDRHTFPFINSFLTILLTLPVSTSGVELSFTTLRRVKTWLRSRMGEKRLTGLTGAVSGFSPIRDLNQNIHREFLLVQKVLLTDLPKLRCATRIS